MISSAEVKEIVMISSAEVKEIVMISPCGDAQAFERVGVSVFL